MTTANKTLVSGKKIIYSGIMQVFTRYRLKSKSGAIQKPYLEEDRRYIAYNDCLNMVPAHGRDAVSDKIFCTSGLVLDSRTIKNPAFQLGNVLNVPAILIFEMALLTDSS